MSIGPMFTGAGATSVTARDFLKDVNLVYETQGLTDSAAKLKDVSHRFRAGSPADTWFQSMTFADWNAFVAAFKKCFAGIEPEVKPRAQRLAELLSMRITLGEMAAEYTLVGEERVAPMVAFRGCVLEAVMDANAGTETEGVWVFHEALPRTLQVAITMVPTTWDDMLTALAAIPQLTIEIAAEAHRKAAAVEADRHQRDRGSRTRPPPPPPNPLPANAPPANGGGGGRGDRSQIPVGTDEQKAHLRRIMDDANRQHQPNTTKGQARYATQIVGWNQRNGNIPQDSLAIWTTGYPLTPGTALL
ncbi:hypothetical protein K438DRAFT_1975346 [Mycena galopus ATCC 62051]|nr:hypothetical protein K438DRAFT_1975346 [Mycena galopus ATCC 62051]